MGTNTSTYAAQWNGVRDWLAGIAASQSELERFFADVFARLNGLLGEFGARQRAWDMDHGRREEELQTRSNELGRREAELRAERERIQEEAAGQVGSPSVASTAEKEWICRTVAELEQTRESLRAVIAAAEGQVSGWSQAAAELAKARDAFLQYGKQDASAQTPAQAESHRALETQIRRKEEELAHVEQDRAMLERELEVVRCRAAELSEVLSQQGRQMVEEREQWSDELKRMRRVLETVAERQLAQPAAEPRSSVAAVSIPTDAKRTSADEAAGDPVLDSVITQFEMLQKDLARRRKAAAG